MKTTEAGETTLSTGEAARFLGVSRQAVVFSIEEFGKIRAQERLHPRAHRRIPVREVLEFMQRNRMEIPEELRAYA